MLRKRQKTQVSVRRLSNYFLFQMNSLNEAVMTDMKEIFTKVQNDSSIKAAVLMSGKPSCFIAGADINMINK